MDINKVLTLTTKKGIAEDLENEIDQREKDRPRRIIVKGMDLLVGSEDLSGGETNIVLAYPLYDMDTGKSYKLVEEG